MVDFSEAVRRLEEEELVVLIYQSQQSSGLFLKLIHSIIGRHIPKLDYTNHQLLTKNLVIPI